MRPIDFGKIRTISLADRAHKVAVEKFAQPPQARRTCADFFAGLPQILAGSDLRQVVNAIVNAHWNKRPVIVGMGAHVIKCGLAPVLIDLMQRRVVTSVALNGAAAIHDFEIAFMGQTSEDVAQGLEQGTFGMGRETAEFMNQAINRVLDQPELGMGFLLADQLVKVEAPYQSLSVLATAFKIGIPVTVHVAIGTDIIHMHPSANGGAIGQATFNDFSLFASTVSELSGGVYLNIGSSVILPEVFLKAFTIAQNLGAKLHDFVTVNMDMQMHYRPGENVVHRPTLVGGRGYNLIGRHEIMIPLVAQAVVDITSEGELVMSAESTRTDDIAPQLSDVVGKIIDWASLLALRAQWRAQQKKIVWTNGCFDLLHVGHIENLTAARKHGDILVVGVNSDDAVTKLKGTGRPIIPLAERCRLLAALSCVDIVVPFDELTPEIVLARLQPEIHCKGADYAPPNGKAIPESKVVESYGGQIVFLPLVPGVSTTDLIHRIRGTG